MPQQHSVYLGSYSLASIKRGQTPALKDATGARPDDGRIQIYLD